jgi:hypothetical protein
MAAALQALGRADEACEALAAARRLRPRLTLAEIELSHGRRVAQGLAAAWAAGDALRGWT